MIFRKQSKKDMERKKLLRQMKKEDSLILAIIHLLRSIPATIRFLFEVWQEEAGRK